MNQKEEYDIQLSQYYKDLYEREVSKNSELMEALVAAEAKSADLTYKLDKLRNSLIWKCIYPFRLVWSHFKNAIIRVRRYGNPKNFIRKVQSKMIERRAYQSYGTESLPAPDEIKKQRETKFPQNIKFSILVPLYNTPEKFLREMIESVIAQTYQNWELCLADGSDKEHAYVEKVCKEYADKDAIDAPLVGAKEKIRIKYRAIHENLGISGNTNVCFEMATGDYIGLFDHDDLLHPEALYEYMKVICEEDSDYIYCDETTFKGNSINHMITLHFKPDFAIDNLRANNYICHFSVFRASLLEKTGLFRSEYDGSQDHDMILRLVAVAEKIYHIPKVLYYWRSHAGSVAANINVKSYAIDAAKGAVTAHLQACGFEGFKIESTRAFETIFRIRYKLLSKPKISILIPNKDHVDDLRRCIESILQKSSYDNIEIIIIENNSAEDDTFVCYEEYQKHPAVQVVTYSGNFNYAKIINFGASFATGEYLILLNNDTEVITRNWIEELLMYAQRQDVGAVGCMLYYEDYSIQHAGIVIGLGAHRTAGHTHYKMEKENLGYMGRLCYAQNVSAVTGACMMTSKELFDELHGLSEEFAVALNDVDYCLRIREKGLLNVFTPFAELFHYESRSRGLDLKDVSSINAKRYDTEAELFRQKWKKVIEAGDPYYNANFSLDYSNYVLKGNDGKNLV